MIFPETFEQKLGFDTIRQRIKGYCLSQSGAAWVEKMRFSTEAEFIKTLLRQSLEFRQILEKAEAFPSRFFFDGQDWLQKISLEGNYLDAVEFLNLANALETVIASRNFLQKSKDIYPQLNKLAEPVSVTS